MANIIVTWTTQDEPVPNAALINHFGIKLSPAAGGADLDDASEPLTARSHTFVNVAPGDYIVTVQSYNSDESQPSAVPLTAPVSVLPEVTAPVAVTVSANVG